MIISGLREAVIKEGTVERTDKAEIRPEEQSEKAERCPENLWNEMQLKGQDRQKQTQEQNKFIKNKKKGVGKLGWLVSKT